MPQHFYSKNKEISFLAEQNERQRRLSMQESMPQHVFLGGQMNVSSRRIFNSIAEFFSCNSYCSQKHI
jgi:hypothetical protein